MTSSTDDKGADLSRLRIARDEPSTVKAQGGIRAAIALYAVGAVVIVLGVLFLYRTFTAEAPAVRTVTVAYASPSAGSALLTASGYVVAQRKASIASKATGRIVALYAREGDRVTTGQIIAKIESDDVVAALEQARAELGVARAALFDARRIFERSDTLLRRNLIAEAEFDAARSRYEGASATVRAREAAVTAAEVALENTNIRAPFDGTVLTKNADIGEVVAPFAAGASSRVAVVTIADMGSLQVETDVSEANIVSVSVRQPVDVALDAYPDRRYRGVVDKIVPTADRAKATVMTKIRFLEIDERVLPEMGAKVHFLAERASESAGAGESFLAVDARAVVEAAAGPSVFVLQGDVATLTAVRTGRTAGSLVEVLDGLSQGARVIVAPPRDLATGARVTVLE